MGESLTPRRRRRPDWFAIIYLLGAFLIANAADETHHAGGWFLLIEAFWVVAAPTVYCLGLFHRTKAGEPRDV